MSRKKKGLSPIDVLRKKFQQHQEEPSAPKKKKIAESTDHHLVECYVCKNMGTKEDLYYVGKRRTGEKPTGITDVNRTALPGLKVLEASPLTLDPERTILLMRINKKSGKLTRIYAHHLNTPCELCDERKTCDKDPLRLCAIHCG